MGKRLTQWGCAHLGAVGAMFLFSCLAFAGSVTAAAMPGDISGLSPEQMTAMSRWPLVLILGVVCLGMGGFLVALAFSVVKYARANSDKQVESWRIQQATIADLGKEFRLAIQELGKANEATRHHYVARDAALVAAIESRPCYAGELHKIVDRAMEGKTP